MDVVAVGDIVLVGNAGDDAEPLLQAGGKLVGGGFQRGAVKGVVDVLGLLPRLAAVVHVLHHAQGKGLCLGVGVALAGHILDALIQAGVAQADGGVAAEQQLVNLLALLEAGQGAVLPQDGGGVAEGAQQPLVAALQGPVAQIEPLVEDLPELLKVAARAQGHVHQVDGDDALVEPAVVFGLVGLGVHVGGQEAAAAHAGVAVALAVFVHLQLQHLLFRDIVGHHPLGGALGGQLGQIVIGGAGADVVLLQHIDQLGEGGGDPDAGLVLDALVALAEHLLNDDGQVGLEPLVVAGFAQVHEHRDEGGLAVGGHQGDHLVLDGLHAAVDLGPQPLFHNGLLALLGDGQALHLAFHFGGDLLAGDVHEGGQVGQADALAAVLVGGHLGDDLGGDVAGGGEGMGLLNQRAGDDSAVLQHVVQVDQVAVVHVLGEVVGVMEVDDAFLMGLDHLGGQQHPHGQVLGDLAGHVVPLHRVDGGVFVGVFLLDLLIVALDQAEDAVVGGVVGAFEALHIPVGDVLAGHLVGAGTHDGVFHQVLDLLHVHGMVAPRTDGLHLVRNLQDLFLGQPLAGRHHIVGLADRRDDLGYIKDSLAAVALDDLHDCLLTSPECSQCAGVRAGFRGAGAAGEQIQSYPIPAGKSRPGPTIYCVFPCKSMQYIPFLALRRGKRTALQSDEISPGFCMKNVQFYSFALQRWF